MFKKLKSLTQTIISLKKLFYLSKQVQRKPYSKTKPKTVRVLPHTHDECRDSVEDVENQVRCK